MSQEKPSFFARLAIAFRVLFSSELAANAVRPALPAPTPKEPSEEPPVKVESEKPPAPTLAEEAAALQLLALLQREGRLIDFLKEDVAEFSDEDIGAAARVVHEGCSKALFEHFTIEPAEGGEEGEAITLESVDPARVRLTGNVAGDPPFQGTLQHAGWVAKDVSLPAIADGHDLNVLAPAEVEL